MIIVSIFGGLGNQMFQYALGRHLSYMLKTDLKFDTSFNFIRTDFNIEDIPFIFDIFDVKGELATESEIKKLKGEGLKRIYNSLYWRWQYLKPFHKQHLIKERFFHFDADIFKCSKNTYLHGYWQSEKYFKGIKNLIIEDFQIKKPIELNNFEIANRINSEESVSIHLRGRDYIKKEEINKIYFTCDESYYERCIKTISEKIQKPHFFIFSDDPEWAKSFLKIDYPFTFVEGNSWNKTNYEDFRLMSMCKHNIIANSSYSWWAAWLNQNPNKIVIAPQKWFNDKSFNASDLIPEEWIKI
ncbi:MAG: alpha-1,2-fucosyltransferase [Bacteroidetes bacterium]|nr:alpha-1,2-fucosyltransferase [Bacteroidota bacterium]